MMFNRILVIKWIMLTLFTTAFLLGNAICNADPTDSKSLRGGSLNMSPISDTSENFFLLDAGTLGPDKPATGNTAWTGDRPTTPKKCPPNYTPSVALTLVSSGGGSGGFYGNINLTASFDTSTYKLSNITAYTNQDISNGSVKFKWEVFCTIR